MQNLFETPHEYYNSECLDPSVKSGPVCCRLTSFPEPESGVAVKELTSSYHIENHVIDNTYIGGPKVSTHRTGHKIERSCGVAEGPEVLFTLARPAE